MVAFPCEAVQSSTFVCWNFFFGHNFNIIISDRSVQTVYFFLIPSWQGCISRNVSISSVSFNLLSITVYSILLWFLRSLWYQLLFLLVHFLFRLFETSLFSSWWSWIKADQFCLSLQKLFLVSMIISIFVSILIISNFY